MLAKLITLLLITNIACAGPWMTGPLLAQRGETIPKGHVNIEPYVFYTVSPMDFKTIQTMPIITFGLTDFMDIQTSIPFVYNWKMGKHGGGIGDFTTGLGLQILRDTDNSYLPNIRLVLQETFPTGRFKNLTPENKHTDQTGFGSYQTVLMLNFQKLNQLSNEHYLRTRLSLISAKRSKVRVHGFNTFGGGFLTDGVIQPGTSYSADLAIEYSLTQNWVPVFEVLYVHNSSTNFDGIPGFTHEGVRADIGGQRSEMLSLAPALEYNFSQSVGIIAGIWFPISGAESLKFTSGVIAINFYL